jgi:cation diffusion facilitator CzcD-associated flavoprotein CzcO
MLDRIPRQASSGASQPASEGFDHEVCVIGAGAAGLAAGRAMIRRGLDIAWFERGSMVGGLWRIDNDNGGTPAYRTLHLNSSRQATAYPSFPMPDDWPDYPSHELMAQYLQDYAEHNSLIGHITFRTEVRSVVPLGEEGNEASAPFGSGTLPGAHGWRVTVADVDSGVEATLTCRSVLVANGHHDNPSTPSFPGEFTGQTFHSRDYDEPGVFAAKDVVVVGVGNSGMDIACDAAKVADHVYLVTRHGVHVIPKYAFGRPADQLSNKFIAYVPFEVERRLYETILRVATGRPQDRGLPAPDHRLLSAHPTVSAELYDRVGHGDIVMKPGITAFAGDEVRFADGSSVHADVVVYATGYRVTLPFLAPEVFDCSRNRMPLYLRVVAPDRPGLFFIGFIQTIGANIALYEYQAEWVGDLLTGAAQLPDRAAMHDWIESDAAAMAHRYVRSDRHTMQVDYWRYIRTLKEARARKPSPTVRDRLTRPLAGLLR